MFCSNCCFMSHKITYYFTLRSAGIQLLFLPISAVFSLLMLPVVVHGVFGGGEFRLRLGTSGMGRG